MILTNFHPRELVEYRELPESARDDFDYLEPDQHCIPRFVKYKGGWIDTLDAMRCPSDLGGGYWHGILSCTYFDAIVWRFTDDREHVIVGHALTG